MGLKNILRMHIERVNSLEWEQIAIPTRYISHPTVQLLVVHIINL